MLVTYNIFNILVRKVEVGECLEVLWEGEAPFLFEVLSRLSNQIYGQMYHVGLSQSRLQRGSLSASAKHSAHSSDYGLAVYKTYKYFL